MLLASRDLKSLFSLRPYLVGRYKIVLSIEWPIFSSAADCARCRSSRAASHRMPRISARELPGEISSSWMPGFVPLSRQRANLMRALAIDIINPVYARNGRAGGIGTYSYISISLSYISPWPMHRSGWRGMTPAPGFCSSVAWPAHRAEIDAPDIIGFCLCSRADGPRENGGSTAEQAARRGIPLHLHSSIMNISSKLPPRRPNRHQIATGRTRGIRRVLSISSFCRVIRAVRRPDGEGAPAPFGLRLPARCR